MSTSQSDVPPAPDKAVIYSAFEAARNTPNALYKFFDEHPSFRLEATDPSLFDAIKNGHNHCAHLLIPRYNGLDSHFDDASMTALHQAAIKGMNRVIRKLIKYGANPAVCDINGKTPLNLACSLLISGNDSLSDNRVDCAEELLMRCDQVNIGSNDGYRPIHFAAQSQEFGAELGELLFGKCGASIDVDASTSGSISNDVPKTAKEFATNANNSEFATMIDKLRLERASQAYSRRVMGYGTVAGLLLIALVAFIFAYKKGILKLGLKRDEPAVDNLPT